MSRTILPRLGAGLVAAALVAGGSLLVAAPASAANDIVTPNSVVENTWGADGTITVSGQGTVGDALGVDIVDGNTPATFTKSYLSTTAVTDVVVGANGTYTITFSLSNDPATSDFSSFPLLGETVFAAVVNNTVPTAAPIFVPIAVTAFVAATPATNIVPTCLSGTEAATSGVDYSATGYAQGQTDVTYSIQNAAGAVVLNGILDPADNTGTVTANFTVFSTINGVQSGPISDGVYTIITTAGSVSSSGSFIVGDCNAPAAVPAAPAAVPAAPQLANTGSSDAGVLVGGSALLLLVGAALVVARRRQNAAA
ncbi:LPXTG cell wall anchor domain-containing protein [Agreia sp. COWG]|uniref:LPXTG cell wall anchor domain-containing protein n=1 Tax=Agreia sp. COWG TaxID=2773266 RepID=UPI00192698C4|nr:LPXTG cell wall anchor domain-containing protein [Agreia sp. COWG]CAD6006870.1 LPXTG-motif cell wall anchor domain-containing protein [Agreia sp. COWG]